MRKPHPPAAAQLVRDLCEHRRATDDDTERRSQAVRQTRARGWIAGGDAMPPNARPRATRPMTRPPTRPATRETSPTRAGLPNRPPARAGRCQRQAPAGPWVRTWALRAWLHGEPQNQQRKQKCLISEEIRHRYAAYSMGWLMGRH